jgi:hypothetical protein
MQGPLTKEQTIKLISALKHSEPTKSLCGHRLIQFYDNLSGPHV